MYSDSNAARRNLMVVSLGFIIFRYGEGEISGDKVSLPMVNLILDNPEFVVTFLWAMILWFAYRYWQVNHKRDLAALVIDLREIFKDKRTRFIPLLKERYNSNVTSVGSVSIDDNNTLWKINVVERLPTAPGRQSRTKRTDIEISGTNWVRVKIYVYAIALLGPYNTLTGMIIAPAIFLFAITPYIWSALGDFISGARLLLNGIPGLI